jgi:hypothetical protein
MILPDWNYPRFRTHMTDAERWIAEHGFTRGTEYRNGAGQSLTELLDGTVGPVYMAGGAAARQLQNVTDLPIVF